MQVLKIEAQKKPKKSIKWKKARKNEAWLCSMQGRKMQKTTATVTWRCLTIKRHCSNASNFAYSYTFLRSVVFRLSHSCILLKQLDWFTCHLPVMLAGFNDIVLDRAKSLIPEKGRGDLELKPQPKFALAHQKAASISDFAFYRIALVTYRDYLIIVVVLIINTRSLPASGYSRNMVFICLLSRTSVLPRRLVSSVSVAVDEDGGQ